MDTGVIQDIDLDPLIVPHLENKNTEQSEIQAWMLE